MTSLLEVRAIAVIVTAIIVCAVPHEAAYTSILISIGMSHYILSVVYARRPIEGLLGNGISMQLVLLATLFVGLLAFTGDDYALFVYYFGLHHVFNEVYSGREKTPEPGLEQALAGVFHGSLYLTLLSADPRVSVAPVEWVVPILAASLLGQLTVRWRSRRSLRELVVDSTFEVGCAVLALAVVEGLVVVHLLDLILYHVVFWLFWPMLKLRGRSRRPLVEFVLQNVLLTTLFLVVSPMALGYPVRGSLFVGLFYVGGYFHITSSFALSDAQPRWITWIFRMPRSEIA